MEEGQKELSLTEKMEKAGAEGADEEQRALALYNSMTKDEKAKAWGKYQVALRKKSDEEKEAYAYTKPCPRGTKGVKAAAFLLEKEGKQHMTCVQHANAKDRWAQVSEWESQLQMQEKEEELAAHLAPHHHLEKFTQPEVQGSPAHPSLKT